MSDGAAGGLPVNRIEALSDGIFAVAMTILVLEIHVPELSIGQPLGPALLALWPKVVSYAVGFIVIGTLWVGHHYQFHFIRRADRPLLWINLLFLMAVSFLPFCVALLGSCGDRPLGVALYGLVVELAGACLVAHWLYATHGRRLVADGAAELDVRILQAETIPRRCLLPPRQSCLCRVAGNVARRASAQGINLAVAVTIVKVTRMQPGMLMMFAAALWGCGTTEPVGGKGRTGGANSGGSTASGSGGSVSGSGSGGAVGGGGGAAAVPGCLQALFAACPAVGACKSPTVALGQSRQYCFGNAVRADIARTGGCQGTGLVVLEVRKADGSLCYTNEVHQSYMCESESFTWKDATGSVVATASFDLANSVHINCATGETGICTPADVQCELGSVWSGKSCDLGSCP